MKRVIHIIVLVISVMMIMAGAVGGTFLYLRYAPSKEKQDLEEWFQVSGDEAAIILDHELVEGRKGRLIQGQIYLPLTWVQEQLNERFYWSAEDHQLIYTFPDSIVYADGNMTGKNGAPLLVEQDQEIWLMSELVQTYSNVRIARFAEDAAKRILIDTDWDPVMVSKVKKQTPIRVRGGVKSKILADAEQDEEVQILEELDNWVKIRSESGYIGYVQRKRLGESVSRQNISMFQEPVYSSISLEQPIRMVWHQVTNKAANSNVMKLLSDTRGVNVVAPTWFMLTDNEGRFESLADQAYVENVHNKGMQVWAVVDNFNKGENVKSEILFASTKARKALIASLMDEVHKYQIDGINLDIEHIKPEAGIHYIQFIRELSIDCRKNGIILSIDSYVPSAYTSFYNRAEQGRVADYVIIMGYDEHYSGSEVGSVASLGYERMGIEKTMNMVPADKIISGIPFYTRLWKFENGKTTSKALGISAAKKWVDENQTKLTWIEELGQYYCEKTEGAAAYYMWMEEERSLDLKMKLVEQYGLAGAAFWRLGYETPEVWDVICP